MGWEFPATHTGVSGGSGLGRRVQGLGLRVWGLELRVLGVETVSQKRGAPHGSTCG